VVKIASPKHWEKTVDKRVSEVEKFSRSAPIQEWTHRGGKRIWITKSDIQQHRQGRYRLWITPDDFKTYESIETARKDAVTLMRKSPWATVLWEKLEE